MDDAEVDAGCEEEYVCSEYLITIAVISGVIIL
jgi:hypothetical protein